MLHTDIDPVNLSVGDLRTDIRRMLMERRRQLLNEIQSRVRDVREEGSSTDPHTTHLGEAFDAEPEEDLAFALIQMKAEMLQRVNEAVRMFDQGAYGNCWIVVRSSVRHGFERCPLPCVAGIANRRARMSSTAGAF